MANQTDSVALLIERFWIAPEDAVWTPKTDVIRLDDLREWMKSRDIEVLGFVNAMIHNQRFRIEPPLDINEYVHHVKHYYGRCFRENPDGEWSNSSYLGGAEVVRIFIKLFDDGEVPRNTIHDLKAWLSDLYKTADERLRTCIVHATLEHLFERKPIRKYFEDWKKDSVLRPAYEQACEWDRKTPLSR